MARRVTRGGGAARPEEAEREILDSAEAFLRERPFRDLTIDEVMDGTGLSRPSFYVYFRDRHDLAMRLIEEIGSEAFGTAGGWLDGEGDDPEELRGAMQGTVAVYEDPGTGAARARGRGHRGRRRGARLPRRDRGLRGRHRRADRARGGRRPLERRPTRGGRRRPWCG